MGKISYPFARCVKCKKAGATLAERTVWSKYPHVLLVVTCHSCKAEYMGTHCALSEPPPSSLGVRDYLLGPNSPAGGRRLDRGEEGT